jgi:hypothetical protein
MVALFELVYFFLERRRSSSVRLFGSLVDRPVISASGLKGNIGRHDAFAGKDVELAQSAKIWTEGILFTSAKDHAITQVVLHVFQAESTMSGGAMVEKKVWLITGAGRGLVSILQRPRLQAVTR